MNCGLVNIGSSCWLSSSIQVLFLISSIRRSLEEFNQSDVYVDAIELYAPFEKKQRQRNNFKEGLKYLLIFYRIYCLKYEPNVRKL
jgi:uncharacterized UBP type Zn finger protein